jgi:hypothetical protein
LREKNNARHAHAVQAQVQAQVQRPMPAPAPAPVRGNNRYAVFEVEDEVEVEVEVEVKVEVQVNETEFPLLGGKSAAVQDTSRVSYAKAFASKPAQAQAQAQAQLTKCVAVGKKQENICEEEEQYGERMYEILYEYFKNEFHRERTSKVVDRLLECSSKERLEEFMSNRLYLEDCADEIFTSLKEFDPLARTSIYREIAEDNDW